MFNPSRDQARRFFIEAWRKYGQRLPLAPMEHIAADIVAMHPEYQGLLADEERALAAEFTPEGGELNPFLHLSLHLAVEEQLSIDQPQGIVAAFRGLTSRKADRHQALHEVLECLGETVWRAQREGRVPDGEAYLECLRRR
jgi:hypothetical protein